jgi:hypothetical protein
VPIRIRSKNSVVKDKAPLPADLEIGELALNAHQDSPAIYLKDAAGAVRKVAGADAVGDKWNRTGTELSPKTAGDSVFTSGDIKIGGTTAAPNITLKADGKIGVGIANPAAAVHLRSALGNEIQVDPASGIFSADGPDGVIIAASRAAGAPVSIRTGGNEKARLTSAGDFLLGGTLPASPNITLKADGKLLAQDSIGIAGPITANHGVGLQLQGLGALNVAHISTNNLFLMLCNNAVLNTPYNGKYKYLVSGEPSTVLLQRGGSFEFHRGPAGTAGDEIPMVLGAILNSTGDFLLGGALPGTPNLTLSAAGNINAKGAVARVYADNAAAKAGGLVDGDIYRTATGQLMIVFT